MKSLSKDLVRRLCEEVRDAKMTTYQLEQNLLAVGNTVAAKLYAELTNC